MADLSLARDARADDEQREGVEVAALARRRLTRFSERLAVALAHGQTATLVCKAGVQVRIELSDLPATTVTLLFDRPPARVVSVSRQRADVVLRMRSTDLESILQRSEHLPLQILAGSIQFEGHVRKLLRVMPILTRAAAHVANHRQS